MDIHHLVSIMALLLEVVLLVSMDIPVTREQTVTTHNFLQALKSQPALCAVIFLIIPLIMLWGWQDSISKWAGLLFWIQTLAGNWSPPMPEDFGNFWFAVSALLAIVVNFATLAAILAVLIDVMTVKRRQAVMRPLALIATRDTAIRGAFEHLITRDAQLSPEQKRHVETLLRQAIENGDKDWYDKYFPEFFLPEDVAEKRRKLETLEI